MLTSTSRGVDVAAPEASREITETPTGAIVLYVCLGRHRFYVGAGYRPTRSYTYLRGLANGRLAELPLREALAADPASGIRCRRTLVDLSKLEDFSADIATLTGQQILDTLLSNASTFLTGPSCTSTSTGQPAVDLQTVPDVGGDGCGHREPARGRCHLWSCRLRTATDNGHQCRGPKPSMSTMSTMEETRPVPA